MGCETRARAETGLRPTASWCCLNIPILHSFRLFRDRARRTSSPPPLSLSLPTRARERTGRERVFRAAGLSKGGRESSSPSAREPKPFPLHTFHRALASLLRAHTRCWEDREGRSVSAASGWPGNTTSTRFRSSPSPSFLLHVLVPDSSQSSFTSAPSIGFHCLPSLFFRRSTGCVSLRPVSRGGGLLHPPRALHHEHGPAAARSTRHERDTRGGAARSW